MTAAPDDPYSGRRPLPIVGAVLAAALLGGCASVPPEPPVPSAILARTATPSASRPPTPDRERLTYPVVVSNGTEQQITIMFEDAEFLIISANGGVTIPAAVAPPVPFELEARLPSGVVIAERRVDDPGGFLVRVGLTCGVLDVWSGSSQPLGPRPDPADDIDC